MIKVKSNNKINSHPRPWLYPCSLPRGHQPAVEGQLEAPAKPGREPGMKMECFPLELTPAGPAMDVNSHDNTSWHSPYICPLGVLAQQFTCIPPSTLADVEGEGFSDILWVKGQLPVAPSPHGLQEYGKHPCACSQDK